MAEVRASYSVTANAVMDVGRYAALVARTETASPAQRHLVHAEHGIGDEPHRARIDEAMRAHLSKDESHRHEYEQHLKQWRAYLGGGS